MCQLYHRRDCDMGCFSARMALSDREISTTDCSYPLFLACTALLPRCENWCLHPRVAVWPAIIIVYMLSYPPHSQGNCLTATVRICLGNFVFVCAVCGCQSQTTEYKKNKNSGHALLSFLSANAVARYEP